jgi:hypothetical protein
LAVIVAKLNKIWENMKKIILFLLLFYSFLNVNGQKTEKDLQKKSFKKIESDSLNVFVQNLQREILNDILKFNKNDLIGLNGNTENSKKYSKMYLVDMKYIYRLDIIESEKVNEFINEILNIEKIETISISENNSCCSLFGKNGTNGCVFITTKKKSKVKYEVAGLKYHKNKRKGGDNFDQNKENGIKIMIRT